MELEKQLKKTISKLFSEKFIELTEISFENTPDSVLQYVIKHEGVHRMSTLDDLKLRLSHGRKCYALFSVDRTVLDTPLAFIHVALTNEYSKSIQ